MLIAAFGFFCDSSIDYINVTLSLSYSRGAFVVFYFLAPAGLLGMRKLTKLTLGAAVSRGAIGRRDIVLIGDYNEMAALEPQDLLAFFGAAYMLGLTARDAYRHVLERLGAVQSHRQL